MRVLRFAALLLLASGCPLDLVVPEAPARGLVKGRIDTQGQGTVEGLDVRLVTASGSRSTQQTDVTGAFTFEDLAPGAYFLEVRRDAFEPLLVPGVEVLSGKQTDLGVLVLLPRTERVTLLGKVVSQGGAVPEGARVELVLDQTMQREAVTLTGADGTFFLTARPGTYTLRASHPLYVTTSRALNPLVVGPPVDLTADPLSLPLNPATLAGRVLGEVDGENSAAPRAQVLVTLDSGETSTTDSTGAFTFTGLAGGPRQVRMSVANFGDATRAITLSPGQLSTLPDVTLALSRGVIQGTVLLNDQQPAQDVTVALTGAAYSTVGVPDLSQPGLGRFRIDRVPNGTYEVTATKNRYGRAVVSSVQVTDSAPVATIGPLSLNVLVGEFRIDDGDPNNAEGFTRNPSVTLQLNAFAGADDYRASEDAADAGAWVAFTALNQPFTLVPLQGRHTITAQYRRSGTASPAFQSSIVLDSLAPSGGAVELNGAELFTNNPLSLSLRLTAADPTTSTTDVSGLGAVRVSLSSATIATDAGAVLNTNPVPYARDLGFSLPQPQVDGPVTVYTQFFDNAGNPSAVVPATITLDRSPPQNVTLRIRDGALATATGFTHTALVQLDHTANLLPDGGAGPGEPDGGYVLFKVSNSSTALDPTPWQPLTPTSSWFLDSSGADLKTVFARFRDAAGNQTSVVQAQISYDATPPSPVSATLLSGSPTNDAGVTLQLAATDSNGLSPTAAVTVSEDPLFSRDLLGPMAMPGNGQVVYRLGDAQGAHQVLVRYLDRAGNGATASVTVVLDTLPPTGARLVVGNGAAVQTGASLPITFEGAAVDVTHMVVTSTAPTCATASYQPFAPTSVLPLADGVRQVFGCLKDAAGNVSAYGPVSVTVDNAAPSAGTITAQGLSNQAASITNTAALTVRFTGISDTTSGVDALRVSTEGTFAGVPFVPVTPAGGNFDYPFVLPPGDGPRTLFAQVRDRAGLVSAPVQTTVRLDTQAPVWTQTIAAQSYVTGATVNLTLAATDNLDTTAELQAGVAATASSCAGASFSALTGTFPVSTLVDGPNSLYLCLKDRAGNSPPLAPLVQVRRIATAPSAASLVPNVPIPLASGALISWSDTNAFTKRIEVDAALDPAFTQSLRTYAAANGSCALGNEAAPPASARVGLQSGELPLTNLRNWYFRLRAINCADAATTSVIVPGSVLPNFASTPTDQALAHGQLVAEGPELWLHAPAAGFTRVELMRYCRVGVSDCRNESSWTSFPLTLSTSFSSTSKPAALFATDGHWFLVDVISGLSLAVASCERDRNCTLPANWNRGESFSYGSGTFTNAVGAVSSSALAVFFVRQEPSLGSAPYLSMARCERWRNCADANNWSPLHTPIRVDPLEPLTVSTSDNQFFIGAVSEGPLGAGPTGAGQPMLIKCDQTCSTVAAPTDGSCNGNNCGCDGGQCGDFRFSRMTTPAGGEVMQASAPVVIASNGQNTAAWFERRCVGSTCTDAIRSSTCLGPDCLAGTDYAQAAVVAQWPGVSGAPRGRFSLTASGTREPAETLRLHWADGSTGATWLASCTVTPGVPCFNTPTRAQLSSSETLESAVAVGRDSYFVGLNQLGRGSLWQPIIPSPAQLVVGPRAGALEVSWAPYEASLPSLLQSAQPDGGAAVTVTLADPFTTWLTIPTTSARSVSLAFTNGSGKGDEVRWTTTPFVAVPGPAEALAVHAVSLGAPGVATSNLNGFIYAASSTATGVRLGRCDSSTDCRVAGNWSWSQVDSGAGFGAVQLATDYPREHQYGPRTGALATAYSTPRLFVTAVNAGQLFLYGCMLTTPTACAAAGAFTKGRLDSALLPLAPGALPSLRASGDRVQVTESTAGNTVVVRFCDGARYPQQTCNPSFPAATPTAQTNLALGHCFSAANWQSVTLNSASHFPASNGTGGATAANPGAAQQSTGEPHPARGFMVVQPRESNGFIFWTCAYGVGDLACGAAAKNDCTAPANWKPVRVQTGRPARHVELVSSAGDSFPTRAMSEQSAGVYVSFWEDQDRRWNVAQCKVEPGRTYDAAWVCGAGATDTSPDSISWSFTSVLRDVQGTPVSSTLRVIGGDLYAAFSMSDRTYLARCAGGRDCMLRSGWNTYALPQVRSTLSARGYLSGGLTGDLVLGVPESDGGVTLLSGGRFTPR